MGMSMTGGLGRRLGLALTALLIGSAGRVLAADIAPVYKAPPVATPPAYSWTGAYVGVNAGYGVARDPTTFGENPFGGAEFDALQPHGWLGGAQLGYNWQFAPHWVTGIEADIQASGQTDTICILRCAIGVADSIEQKLPWFGTVRGRLGWASGPLLIYGTGGVAYGREETTANVVDTPAAPLAFSFAHDKTGWAAGGGIEAALAGNWTAKAEYLHLDLGSATDAYSYFGLAFANTQYFRDNIFRLGLNYRFGDPQPTGDAYASAGMPVKAAGGLPYSWSGVYVGLNTGYGIARDPSSYTVAGFQPENESFNLDPAGWLGGAQAGANWQLAHVVLGLETDIQGTSEKASPTCIVVCNLAAPPQLVEATQKMPWFGTLRGRLGWADGPILYYATGGLAYGRVESTLTQTTNILVAPFAATNVLTIDQTRLGWTAGGGIEGRIAGNWTAKAEYLYLDLGSRSGAYLFNFGNGFVTSNAFATDLREHIFRVGVNYKID